MSVDLKQSLQLKPECLQSGLFLVTFYILHPLDVKVTLLDQRYWIEYHPADSPHQLNKDYKLIQPTDMSPKIAHSNKLVPYQEWLHICDGATHIHGPFNFSTKNNRQTRDRIDQLDWTTLQTKQSMYSNTAPHVSRVVQANNISVTWNDPIITEYK